MDLQITDQHVVSTSDGRTFIVPAEHDGTRRTTDEAEEKVRELVNPENNEEPVLYYEGTLLQYVQTANRDGIECIVD